VPNVAGRLTTHVLDTASGGPAAGMAIELFLLQPDGRLKLGEFTTNDDGRCDGPLLADAALVPGNYEIVFAVGSWRGSDSGFYPQVPIRFCVTDPLAHYHVPLILAPFGYSTYRGS
jgi:hydroxyisourate hydrolase